MKRKSIIATILTGVLALSIVGCSGGTGSASADDKVIKIGVSPIPHKEIVEQIIPSLEEKGYTVEVIEFADYVTPNTALAEGEIDANYFQHIAFLDETNANKGLDLTYTAAIHLEPIAVYSNLVNDLKDLKDGATIAVPNDPANEARALKLLEKEGLIKIKKGELITINEISENPKNLKFEELDAAQLARVLEEVDVAVINSNYALEAGFNPVNDSLAIEDKDAEASKIYQNILAVKSGNEDLQKIKDLTEALTSDTVRDYINEKYDGAVIPSF